MVHNRVGSGAALLVIDVQQGLFTKPVPVYRSGELLTNIASLVAHARESGAVVVYVQHSSSRQLRTGSDDWQLHPGLHLVDGDLIIHKTHGNAFEQTLLHDELAARGVQRLIVTGLVTHGCIRATVQAGLHLGYDVTVASDAHSSYSKDADRLLDAWNGRMADIGAQVLPTVQLVT